MFIASPTVYSDLRGDLYAFWRKGDMEFVEDRFSRSHKGVLRGFHGDSYTWKLFGCVWGKVKLVLWDAANKKRYDYELDSKSPQSVLIPPNWLNAHQCLEDSLIFYKWTAPYSLENQVSIRWNDPIIGADWPLDPILSERDSKSPYL